VRRRGPTQPLPFNKVGAKPNINTLNPNQRTRSEPENPREALQTNDELDCTDDYWRQKHQRERAKQRRLLKTETPEGEA
jgi:hypothetical protein